MKQYDGIVTVRGSPRTLTHRIAPLDQQSVNIDDMRDVSGWAKTLYDQYQGSGINALINAWTAPEIQHSPVTDKMVEGLERTATLSGLMSHQKPKVDDAAPVNFMSQSKASGGGLPAGMRNNNPGNIKYRSDVPWDGLLGPSVNTDQGDPQAVFASPELGMRAAAKLALNKYKKGMRTANQLIAGEGGWTPGYAPAAANIAKAIGVGPDDDLGLDDPVNTQKFLRALLRQEHGPASDQYPDSMITGGIQAAASSQQQSAPMATDWLKYANAGATRSQPLDPKLVGALGFLKDLGVQMEVFSGGQPATGLARIGSHRHDNGGSADVFFSKDGRKLDWANPADVPIFQDIVRRGKAAGVTGFGAGPGYMQPGSMHIGFGSPAVWGAGGKFANAPDWLRAAYEGAALGNAPAVSQVADGPKGQEAYQPMLGSMAPGGMPAQDSSTPMFVAEHWNSLGDDGKKKNPLSAAGAAFDAAAKENPAPRINGAFSGDARQSGDLLMKAIQNPQALAQMLMKMRIA